MKWRYRGGKFIFRGGAINAKDYSVVDGGQGRGEGCEVRR